MGARGKRRPRGDRGAVAVEFALVTYFALIPLLLGIIGFGFIFYSQITITQAAREGARVLSLCNTSKSVTCASDAASRAKLAADPVKVNYPGIASNNITIVTSCAGADPTKDAKLTVTYTVNAFLFSITLTGRASFPCGG